MHSLATRGKLVIFWTLICPWWPKYEMQTETFIFICGNFTHQAGRFDVCLSRDYVFFWKIWLSFSKMTPHWMNLLILRDIVWDNHTNLLIQFGVNQTKNMTTRGKWVIFLKYGWVFTTWPLLNEFADFERYSVRPPYKLTYKIWSKLDQKYGCQGQISDFFFRNMAKFFQ